MEGCSPEYSIGISEDVAYSKVSTEYLETKLTKVLAPSSPASEAKALGDIIKTLESAKAPIIVVDGGAARHQWTEFVDDFIEALKIPFFVTVLGKGVANEKSPYYSGPYAGVGSLPNAIKAVSESDMILWLGNYPSDFNTCAFSLNLAQTPVLTIAGECSPSTSRTLPSLISSASRSR